MISTEEPLRVVIHASGPQAMVRARSNARNLLRARPEAEVEIVINSGAVQALMEGPLGDTVTDPLIRICGNTLTRLGRTAPAGLKVVPVAIVHLAERQGQGWAYIRA